MALYDVFLNFRNHDIRKNFTEMLHTLIDGEEKHSETAIFEDLVELVHLDFSTFLGTTESIPSSMLYFGELVNITDHSRKEKWSNSGAYNKVKLLVSNKYESVYRGDLGMGMMKSWKRALVVAVATDDFTLELRNLAATKVDKIPHSVFCCCVDSFLSLQKKKGISWKASATDAASTTLDILVHSDFKSAKILDLRLASSTGQPQTRPKMFSNLSTLTFSFHPTASESNETSSLSSECIKGKHATYRRPRDFSKNNFKTNFIPRAPAAHPPPENEMIPKNYHLTQETSLNSLFVTIFMVATFVAALGFSSTTFKDAYSTNKDTFISCIIIAMNTLVFIVSLVTDLYLLHKSTYKWELQVTLFALFGAYICLMKVMIPLAAFPLFMISVPFLFLAAG